MPCGAERAAFYTAEVAAGGLVGLILGELSSGAGAVFTPSTVVGLMGAVGGLIATGWSLANCLEQAGKPNEAEQLRRQMEELQRELDELERRVPVPA
jgi:hypothetical protein